MNIAPLKPLAALKPRVGKSIRQVIIEVGAKHGFSYIEMLSHRRPTALAWARQEAYWRCARETVYSLPNIAYHFGDRDHTTVLHGLKVYAARRAKGEPDIHPDQARLLAAAKAVSPENVNPENVNPENLNPEDASHATP